MPELAEVEFARKQWNEGKGSKITKVEMHAEKRIFRGQDTGRLQKALKGQTFLDSEAKGKQMLFRFSGNCWLGIHLGMTGHLSVATANYSTQKHDHLVLRQKERTLVFNDARQFGRVLFSESAEVPEWWSQRPPEVASAQFTFQLMAEFLKRHSRLPIKASLLLQSGFPGVGNWMADEILWRAGIWPKAPSGKLAREQMEKIWRESKGVCRVILKKVGEEGGDPPKGWLFHERWNRKGNCPKHRTPLNRETIGGRTTAWCPKCQPL